MNAESAQRWPYMGLLPLLLLPSSLVPILFSGDSGVASGLATLPGSWLPAAFNIEERLLWLRYSHPESWVIAWRTFHIAGGLLAASFLGFFMDLLSVPQRVCFSLLGIVLILGAILEIKLQYFGADFFFLICWAVILVGMLSILVEAGRRGLR